MEIRLIRFIRTNPFMYDKKHSSYRDQLLKQEKWTELSREMNVPADVLKKRWKSLRDRFFRLRKINASDTPKYEYYTSLLFLCDVEQSSKKTLSSYKINGETVDEILTKSEDSFLLDQASFSSFCIDDTESLTSASTSRKRKHSEDIEEVLLSEPNISGTQNSTPFRIFLESVALTVEKANFDMDEVMRLQMSILELVQNEMKKRIHKN